MIVRRKGGVRTRAVRPPSRTTGRLKAGWSAETLHRPGSGNRQWSYSSEREKPPSGRVISRRCLACNAVPEPGGCLEPAPVVCEPCRLPRADDDPIGLEADEESSSSSIQSYEVRRRDRPSPDRLSRVVHLVARDQHPGSSSLAGVQVTLTSEPSSMMPCLTISDSIQTFSRQRRQHVHPLVHDVSGMPSHPFPFDLVRLCRIEHAAP